MSFNDNLTTYKYPFMQNKGQLINDLTSNCSIVFNENKGICRFCDVYKYCLEKHKRQPLTIGGF